MKKVISFILAISMIAALVVVGSPMAVGATAIDSGSGIVSSDGIDTVSGDKATVQIDEDADLINMSVNFTVAAGKTVQIVKKGSELGLNKAGNFTWYQGDVAVGSLKSTATTAASITGYNTLTTLTDKVVANVAMNLRSSSGVSLAPNGFIGSSDVAGNGLWTIANSVLDGDKKELIATVYNYNDFVNFLGIDMDADLIAKVQGAAVDITDGASYANIKLDFDKDDLNNPVKLANGVTVKAIFTPVKGNGSVKEHDVKFKSWMMYTGVDGKITTIKSAEYKFTIYPDSFKDVDVDVDDNGNYTIDVGEGKVYTKQLYDDWKDMLKGHKVTFKAGDVKLVIPKYTSDITPFSLVYKTGEELEGVPNVIRTITFTSNAYVGEGSTLYFDYGYDVKNGWDSTKVMSQGVYVYKIVTTEGNDVVKGQQAIKVGSSADYAKDPDFQDSDALLAFKVGPTGRIGNGVYVVTDKALTSAAGTDAGKVVNPSTGADGVLNVAVVLAVLSLAGAGFVAVKKAR